MAQRTEKTEAKRDWKGMRGRNAMMTLMLGDRK